MVGDAFYLARKDLRYLFRSWETWFWAFGMPIVFFYFIGAVTGQSSGSANRVETIGLHVEPNAGFLADQLARRLEGVGYQVDLVDAEKLEQYRRRLTVPAGFTKTALAGEQATADFRRTGAGLGADYDSIRVKRAVYAVLADLIVTRMEGGEVTAESFARLAAEPRALTVAVTPAGERLDPPTGFEQSVPGTMVMFTLLVMFTAGGVSLLVERRQGILRRLASAPIARGAVVLGKWGSRYTLGVLQVTWAMFIGTILFGITWGPSLPALVVLLLAYAALAAVAGMLLGNFSRSEGQAVGIGVILSNILAALGGCWWPIEITPLWAQKLSLALPTGWAMDALHKLVSFGASPLTVFPHIAVMVAAALFSGWLMARSFRFQ